MVTGRPVPGSYLHCLTTNKMNYKILASPASINDATDYYITLIETAVEQLGGTVHRVERLSAVEKSDVIITIEAKFFLSALLKRPSQLKINWFQGIVPEENDLLGGPWLRKWLWTLAEYLALHRSRLNIMVSEAMLAHYRKKYHYRKNNFLIVPCYNKQLDHTAFSIPSKFEKPNFVYAGSMATWQSIDKTLMVFREIEHRLPEATLTLLTGQQKEAQQLINKYGIKNVTVKYCPLDQLDEELKEYKYGFLLREDHIVNRVATPTKMNTYLSAGIIPVYTNVVDSFEQHIDLGKYALKFSAAASASEIAEGILLFEEQNDIDPGNILQVYAATYKEYYNDLFYLEKIKAALT